MSVIKVEDVAFVRFQVPDLKRMEQYLTDFGMVRHRARSRSPTGSTCAGAVRARSCTPPSSASPPSRRSASAPRCVDDLAKLAAETGAKVEASDEPGGGSIVRLKDPDGHGVEVVAGWTPAAELPLEEHIAWNNAHLQPRQRLVKRTGAGSATVVRLGHLVLNVSDFRRAQSWYKSLFGLLTSDEIMAGPDVSVGAFLRCNRGDQPTDHHTLALVSLPTGATGFNHAAFEVGDMDDLMRGHNHLKAIGAAQEWGVGRHFLGSQVFDYWRDPWGFTLEHWTDGDLFTADDAPRQASLQEVLDVQWGPAMPASMTG